MEYLVGDRVKLIELPINKELMGFKVGDKGTIQKVNSPAIGYCLIQWDNHEMITDSKITRITKI
jgi:hypothetical protein